MNIFWGWRGRGGGGVDVRALWYFTVTHSSEVGVQECGRDAPSAGALHPSWHLHELLSHLQRLKGCVSSTPHPAPHQGWSCKQLIKSLIASLILNRSVVPWGKQLGPVRLFYKWQVRGLTSSPCSAEASMGKTLITPTSSCCCTSDNMKVHRLRRKQCVTGNIHNLQHIDVNCYI